MTSDFRKYLPLPVWIFLFGALISSTGTWMQMVAQGWVVAELSKEPFWSGFAGFCQGIPLLFLSLLGGIFSDRWNRRLVLFITQTSLALLAFLLAYYVTSPHLSVGGVCFFALLTGIATAISNPAYHSFLFDISGRDSVSRAVSINASQMHLSRMVGPAIAGVCLAKWGSYSCFLINAISFFAILPMIYWVPQVKVPVISPLPPKNVIDSVKEVFHFAIKSKNIQIALIVTFGMSAFIIPHITLLALYVKETLHKGPDFLSSLWVYSGLGSLLGSFILTFYAKRIEKHAMKVIFGAGGLAALGLTLFTFATTPRAMFLTLFFTGISIVSVNVTTLTFIQRSVTSELRGRMLGLWGTVFHGMFPLGNFLVGTIAQLTSILWAWRIACLALLVLLFSQGIRLSMIKGKGA